MMCAWCGRPSEKRLCDDCYDWATDIPKFTHTQLDDLPYGVIKLDKAGTVLSFNRAEGQMSRLEPSDVVGRNFFQQIAPCSRVQRFMGRFGNFLKGHKFSEQFDFTYRFEHGVTRVRLLLVRLNEEMAFVVSKRIEQ